MSVHVVPRSVVPASRRAGRVLRLCVLGATWLLASFGGSAAWPTRASAQTLPDGWYPSEPGTNESVGRAPSGIRAALPGRLVLQVGAGLSVRTSVDPNFRQDRLAPAFLDLAATWITRSDRPALRFGPTLELSTNLTYDGPAVRGVRPWSQWVLAPGFTVRFVPSASPVPRLVLELRPAVLWVVSPSRTWGLAGTLGVAYMLRAALGVYVEATASIVAGGGTRDAVFTRPAMVSLEAGVRVDVERLP